MDKKKKSLKMVNCDSCVHYMYDEEYDMDVCEVSLDGDEMLKYMQEKNSECPYYRFYDEYKSVQKQN